MYQWAAHSPIHTSCQVCLAPLLALRVSACRVRRIPSILLRPEPEGANTARQQVGTSAESDPPYPILSYKGDLDNFSLCTGRSVYYDFDITVLIYKPDRSSSDKHGDYQFGTCYPVTVYLVAQ